MDTELLLLAVHNQRLVVDYIYVASAVVLVYDYFLTLEREISLVWSSSRSYTKIVFLTARYLPIPGVFMLLYNQTYLGASQSTCSWSFYTSIWLSVIGVLCAEGIFMVRTWAVWNRNRRLGIFLVGLACAMLVIECYSIINFTKSVVVLPPPYPEWRGCFAYPKSSAIYIALYCLASIDAIVFGLMAYSAFRAYKLNDNLRLTNIIHRDGVLFYIYITCLVFASATVVRLAQPSFMNLLYPLPVVLYSVFSARVILNIRSAAGEEDPSDPNAETELHTMYDEAGDVAMYGLPLTFRHENVSEDDLDEVDSSYQPEYEEMDRSQTHQQFSV